MLSSSLNLDEVFDAILVQILKVIPLRAVNIGLLFGDKVRVVHFHGFEAIPEAASLFQNEFVLADFPLLQQVCETRLPQIVLDVRQVPSWIIVPGLEWVVSYAIAPLLTGERVIGFLNLFGDEVVDLSPEMIRQLNAFAIQAAVAIQNARLYDNLAKALENEKAIRKKMIQEEKFSAMGRLLASVSHELNNPLQTIKNCLFLIKKACKSDEYIQATLEMAISETTRIGNLVAQLRELYRPKLEGQRRSYDLSHLLEEVHQLVAPHLLNQKVHWQQDPAHAGLEVMCVPEQMKQVLINLCMNAVEAMQPGGGSLKAGVVVSDDELRAGMFVQDTGPGIPADILTNIFEPFITTKAKGLGLGLSICYELVQRHNGQIQVESQENVGTTFTIWLPALKTETPVP
jgi:signal transduction histidine kinase